MKYIRYTLQNWHFSLKPDCKLPTAWPWYFGRKQIISHPACGSAINVCCWEKIVFYQNTMYASVELLFQKQSIMQTSNSKWINLFLQHITTCWMVPCIPLHMHSWLNNLVENLYWNWQPALYNWAWAFALDLYIFKNCTTQRCHFSDWARIFGVKSLIVTSLRVASY